jgi:Dopa 4,5-dioxygenase family
MEPPTDLREVIESEIKYERTVVSARILRHVNLCLENGIFVSFDRIFFSLLMYRLSVDIYFHQRNADEHHAALQLRDAVLRLRYNGAFIAVPLFRVNTEPVGPHPVGSSIFFSGKEHSRLNILSRIVRNLGSSRIVWISFFIPLSQSREPQVF